ncbi:hypothetical protein KYK30_32035 [Shinella yambaruensis]|uniref:hypothetical protein n=1 Tax=Shinella yambaruensis TaxID=415996 RepID=UPI001FD25AD6|nr:hypothetical protein [Shinella yambaruensis]MCJ8030068.1 hypothetical protein [Shinella yambaruensis]MCU7984357.1 hypothetical protein [Shinella yambaruensis]
MTAPQRCPVAFAFKEPFALSGQPRKFPEVEAVPVRWPTKRTLANELVDHWFTDARAALGKLSKETLNVIRSNISRKNGTFPLSDVALADRSGRSLSSTERDVQRLKRLGYLIAEHHPLEGRQGRRRVLKLAFPAPVFVPQRIAHGKWDDCPSTYRSYVEGINMGERRDV